MPRTNAVVIGIEQILKLVIKACLFAAKRGDDKLFEKPSGVREMPFRRAGILHRLHCCISIRQGFYQGF